MTYRHPLALLLGLEGVALLRAYAGDGYDRAFVEARFEEIRAMLHRSDGPLADDGVEVGRTGTVEGYRTWSETYDTEDNPLLVVEQPVVRRILDDLPAGCVLDAACGTGRHARYLAARGHRVVGVDSSPDMLARARTAVPHGRFLLGELTALPFPADAFDLVVCCLALSHVPALAPVLAEFARVLRSGGHLVLSDIHVASLYLGGVPHQPGPDGRPRLLRAGRYLASDYLAAALPAGLVVRGCEEPRWTFGDFAVGPLAEQWCPEAARAAYDGLPAVIAWHFQRQPLAGAAGVPPSRPPPVAVRRDCNR